MSATTISKSQLQFLFIGVIALIISQIGSAIYFTKKTQNVVVTSKDIPVTSANVNKYIDDYFEEIHQKQIAGLFEKYELADENTPKRLYGSAKARFTLTEFSDIECPFCKKFHPIPKSIVDASNGLINWEWNHFPLPMHNPAAFMEAHGAECAKSIKGNKAFWVYTDQLFQRTKGNGNGAGDLLEIAKYIGIDSAKFEKCMKEGWHRDELKAQVDKATSLNINSTPSTFLVDNSSGDVIPIEGQVTAETVANAIEKHVQAK